MPSHERPSGDLNEDVFQRRFLRVHGLDVARPKRRKELRVVGQTVKRKLSCIARPGLSHLESNNSTAAREPECPRTVEGRNRAIDEKCHSVAEFIGGDHVVGREEDRGARLADFANDVSNQARGDRIEAGGRLVEKQEFGAMQQRSRKRESASHALRELGNALVAIFVEADTAQQRLRRLRVAAMKAGEQAEVLHGGELQVVIRSFERNTNPTVVASIPRAEVSSEHTNIALIAVEESDEHILGRALACSAWAKESKDFVRFDGEGQTANGGAAGPRICEAERINVDNDHVAGLYQLGARCHGVP